MANAIAAAQASNITIELDLYPPHSQRSPAGSSASRRTIRRPAATARRSSCSRLGRARRDRVPDRPPVRGHERVQPAAVPQPAVGRVRAEPVGGDLRARARGGLRRGEGGRPERLRLGPRPLAARQRQRAASTNSSTSPVRFVGYLGAWFKAFAAKTHRTAPLMDGLDFHPYPVPQSLAFATGYPDVRDASVTNLPRIYRAFYDAFHGSPQRTIGQQPGGGLPVSLNETGIQTASPYGTSIGTEVSATSAGGVSASGRRRPTRRSGTSQMLNLVACDPNVRLVNIFHLLDEYDLSGWQSGLFFADETPKQSAAAVRTWLAAGAACQGTPTRWTPATTPVAAAQPRSRPSRRSPRSRPSPARRSTSPPSALTAFAERIHRSRSRSSQAGFRGCVRRSPDKRRETMRTNRIAAGVASLALVLGAGAGLADAAQKTGGSGTASSSTAKGPPGPGGPRRPGDRRLPRPDDRRAPHPAHRRQDPRPGRDGAGEDRERARGRDRRGRDHAPRRRRRGRDDHRGPGGLAARRPEGPRRRHGQQHGPAGRRTRRTRTGRRPRRRPVRRAGHRRLPRPHARGAADAAPVRQDPRGRRDRAGKTVAGLEAAITAAATTKLDAAVAAGTLTASQESARLADLKADLDDIVNSTGPPNGGHGGPGGPGGPPPSAGGHRQRRHQRHLRGAAVGETRRQSAGAEPASNKLLLAGSARPPAAYGRTTEPPIRTSRDEVRGLPPIPIAPGAAETEGSTP